MQWRLSLRVILIIIIAVITPGRCSVLDPNQGNLRSFTEIVSSQATSRQPARLAVQTFLAQVQGMGRSVWAAVRNQRHGKEHDRRVNREDCT